MSSIVKNNERYPNFPFDISELSSGTLANHLESIVRNHKLGCVPSQGKRISKKPYDQAIDPGDIW